MNIHIYIYISCICISYISLYLPYIRIVRWWQHAKTMKYEMTTISNQEISQKHRSRRLYRGVDAGRPGKPPTWRMVWFLRLANTLQRRGMRNIMFAFLLMVSCNFWYLSHIELTVSNSPYGIIWLWVKTYGAIFGWLFTSINPIYVDVHKWVPRCHDPWPYKNPILRWWTPHFPRKTEATRRPHPSPSPSCWRVRGESRCGGATYGHGEICGGSRGPSGNDCHIAMENGHGNSGFSH